MEDKTAEQPDNAPASPESEPPADEQSSVERSYAINGEPVDQATFETLFGRLDVDATPYSGETVVEPDGSYGGAGEVFHARDGDIAYRYEFHTYPLPDDKVGESRQLFREDAE